MRNTEGRADRTRTDGFMLRGSSLATKNKKRYNYGKHYLTKDGTKVRTYRVLNLVFSCLKSIGCRNQAALPNGKRLKEILNYMKKKGLDFDQELIRNMLESEVQYPKLTRRGFLTKIRRGHSCIYYVEFRHQKLWKFLLTKS